ncbi:Hypothetical protein A7982_01599 [Minicystis rosea]|nr:Hypothetical protein A7982_01599 [Minicystis rosea]
MKTLMRTRHLATILLLAMLAPAAACGGSGGTGTTAGGGSPTSSGTTGSGGSGGTAGSGGGSTGTGGSEPATTTVSLAEGITCLDLATGALDVANPCVGDLVFLQGINVDLSSNGGGSMVYCPKQGTFESLSSIPKDYATCPWTSYVEGADGLSNTGYVVRDAAAAHHYRFWIVSNLGSEITFALDKID